MHIKSVISTILALSVSGLAYAAPVSLIQDTSKKMDDNTIAAIEKEVEDIHKGNSALDYRIYTYIYEDNSKNVKTVAKEFMNNNPSDGKPAILFVFNRGENKYLFIEDMKLAPYVSSAYLEELAEPFSDGMTSDELKEFLIRIDSITKLSIEGDFAYNGKLKSSTDIVEVKDLSKLKKAEPESKNDSTKAKEEPNYMLYTLIAAIASIAIVFAWRKKKGSPKRVVS